DALPAQLAAGAARPGLRPHRARQRALRSAPAAAACAAQLAAQPDRALRPDAAGAHLQRGAGGADVRLAGPGAAHVRGGAGARDTGAEGRDHARRSGDDDRHARFRPAGGHRRSTHLAARAAAMSRAWARFSARPANLAALGVVLALAAIALFADAIAP